MQLEFQNTLYTSPSDMTFAIAQAWLTASGKNRSSDVARFLDAQADAELADEAIQAWRLDKHPYAGMDAPAAEKTWMEQRGITRYDVIGGFAQYRQRFLAARSEAPTPSP